MPDHYHAPGSCKQPFAPAWDDSPPDPPPHTPVPVTQERAGSNGIALPLRGKGFKDSALQSQDRPLRGENLFQPHFGQIDQAVQLGAGEAALFRRGLGFDESAVGGHHHIHVHFSL